LEENLFLQEYSCKLPGKKEGKKYSQSSLGRKIYRNFDEILHGGGGGGGAKNFF
jgi:hypothetical protein